ncbi:MULTISPECIES: heavy metal translocating P-type ATPase [Haloferax]|uniref:P-type Cu(+) transporter n=1 Tax=Haloferax marinum TaxID=2666143 RepID=A0A6A8GD36_9EURY|nr:MULTISPECIES: cation-translocating P-type ATPase [Haloferax]KAB1191193.1 heavy metal translocating P-type ATPase [Haloferax sp. CBA1150]MRW98083.1 heavy metal translocating P-type ATPase [Haloferax marinum]
MSEHDGRVHTDEVDASETPSADDCGCGDACDVDVAADVTTSSPDGSASASAPNRAAFGVPDMDCPSCAGKVESSVRTLDGIGDVDPQVTTGRLVVDYDPDRTTLDDITSSIEGAGYTVADEPTVRTITLSVPDMDCPSCAGKVENALDTVPGVLEYETRPTVGTAIVTVSADTNPETVVEAVENAGYEVTGTDADELPDSDSDTDRSTVWRSRRAMKTWVSGGFLAAGIAAEYLFGIELVVASLLGVSFTLPEVLYLAGAAVGGQEILRNGYYSARNRSLDIDLLMSSAIISAVVASLISPPTSLYFEAATLAFLFSVSELLERYAMDQTRNSLRELMDLSPDEATVRRDGTEQVVPVEAVEVGDVVVVKPGEKIPVDGTVLDGESAVNQAPITGESVPVDKVEGDEVYAGTVNEAGYLEVRVDSAAGDDTLSRIVSMVEDAQANKTEREQFVERFSGYYTPFMVAVAVGVATIPPLVFGLDWVTWFVYGITMLVLACPCAFVISTPVSVVSGITSAARNGVLIKGGTHLEAMGAVEAIALDKTGTLTKGELTVTDVVPLNGNSEEDVLRCARGLEARSEHPIGQAIVSHAADNDLDTREVSGFESITGKGVRADLDGVPHFAGKPGLFEELDFHLDHVHITDPDDTLSTDVQTMCDRQGCLNLVEDTIPRLQAEGKTVVLVGKADELEGIVAVADEVRPEAKATVERLRSFGLSVVMLTGDNEGTARAIAEQVGVDDFRAGLLPEDKVAAVEGLLDEYESVAMVGDGINDAPALATATVGVAMGAAGTDTALETADIALMADDISKLPYLYELSHQANHVIRQNIWASLGVKALLAVGVPFGFVSVALAVLAGDAGMTLGVTGNAMRLARIRPDE